MSGPAVHEAWPAHMKIHWIPTLARSCGMTPLHLPPMPPRKTAPLPAPDLDPEHDPGFADRCVRGLTSCPLPRFRDPARAIELAGRAAVNFPNNPMLASTLGLARYRVSDWKGAIAALTASKKERDPGDVADWLILAMAHHRAGDKAQAKIWFERATSTAGDDVPRGRAWLSLREEAKAIMGIP